MAATAKMMRTWSCPNRAVLYPRTCLLLAFVGALEAVAAAPETGVWNITVVNVSASVGTESWRTGDPVSRISSFGSSCGCCRRVVWSIHAQTRGHSPVRFRAGETGDGEASWWGVALGDRTGPPHSTDGALKLFCSHLGKFQQRPCLLVQVAGSVHWKCCCSSFGEPHRHTWTCDNKLQAGPFLLDPLYDTRTSRTS